MELASGTPLPPSLNSLHVLPVRCDSLLRIRGEGHSRTCTTTTRRREWGEAVGDTRGGWDTSSRVAFPVTHTAASAPQTRPPRDGG